MRVEAWYISDMIMAYFALSVAISKAVIGELWRSIVLYNPLAKQFQLSTEWYFHGNCMLPV